ncbi:hypothetical protein, partial [uncultured Corynebacterium sp.]|uniref:hypothetical protein n=1 Tax=uncultured Corynebacterium sp. TaxID=159447 RepID=UPI0025F52577
MNSPPKSHHRLSLDIDKNTAARITRDRANGHRLLMSMLPDGIFTTDSPRAEADLLWDFSSPTTLTVSTRIPLARTGGITITKVPSITLNDDTDCVLTSTVEATRMKAAFVPAEIWSLPDRPNIHGKRIPVPAEELGDWLTDKLAANGFSVKRIQSLEPQRLPVKNRTIPAARFTVAVTVTDVT